MQNMKEASEYKKLSETGASYAGFGLAMLLIGRIMLSLAANLLYIGISLIILGFILYLIGCFRIAKGKGYKAVWGLLGLLTLPGLFFLYVLPDRSKNIATIQPKDFN